RGLDRPAWRRIEEHHPRQHTFRLMDLGLLIFDVKTHENLSAFNPHRNGITAISSAYMAHAGLSRELRGALSRLPYRSYGHHLRQRRDGPGQRDRPALRDRLSGGYSGHGCL